MDWTKHSQPVPNNDPNVPQVGTRRVAVPVTPQLNALMVKFKDSYPQGRYSDAAVLKTFVEAGARAWIMDISQPEPETSTPEQTEVTS